MNSLDVIGIGNAIVDLLVERPDAALAALDIPKGSMTLIDEARKEALLPKFMDGITRSGGSVANTMAGIASFGGAAGFVGKVAADDLGAYFASDIRGQNVAFDVPPLVGEEGTGCCLVAVTPDAERTMSTCLGASVRLGPEDIDADRCGAAQILYIEGYLFDSPSAKAALEEAVAIAKKHGMRVALALSDVHLVQRHHDTLRDFAETRADILFGNDGEMTALYGGRLEEALEDARADGCVAVATCGAQGALIRTETELVMIAPGKVAKVVDTTGAGDLFAAGVLFGVTHGLNWTEAGRIGAKASAHIIARTGARPEMPLISLLDNVFGPKPPAP